MLVMIKYGSENPGDCWKMTMATRDDVVVLIQNGILWAVSDDIDPFLGKRTMYALDADLFARGYNKDDSKVPLIDYEGLADLIEKHEKSMG